VPRELTGEKGKLIFKAHHSNGEAVIHWILDDELVATTSRFHEVGVSPGKGKHSISLTDDKGNAIVRSFEVLEKTNN
jgi:penicillin-binding protein 1C